MNASTVGPVPSCLLTDLPDELLVLIFHCTRRQSLRTFVALAATSRRLYELHLEASLWRALASDLCLLLLPDGGGQGQTTASLARHCQARLLVHHRWRRFDYAGAGSRLVSSPSSSGLTANPRHLGPTSGRTPHDDGDGDDEGGGGGRDAGDGEEELYSIALSERRLCARFARVVHVYALPALQLECLLASGPGAQPLRIEGDVVAVACDGEIHLYDLLPSSCSSSSSSPSSECASLVATARAPSRTIPRVASETYGCYDVCVAMRGRLLVAIYGCERIRICDLDTADDGVLVAVPEQELPKELVEDVQFVSDTVFAVSLSLYTITLMNVQGQRVAVLRNVLRVPRVTPWYDVGRVSCLYAQGPILCTGDGAGAIKSWDWAGGRLMGRVQAHLAHVMDVHLSVDGKRMVTAGHDNRVSLWERTTTAASSHVDPHHHTSTTRQARQEEEEEEDAVRQASLDPSMGVPVEEDGEWTWIRMGELQFVHAVHAVRLDDDRLYVAAGNVLHVVGV